MGLLDDLLDRASGCNSSVRDPNLGTSGTHSLSVLGSKEGTVSYRGQKFSIPRHGFVRDSYFQGCAQSQQVVTFLGINDEALYPLTLFCESPIFVWPRLTVSCLIIILMPSQVLYYSLMRVINF